LKIFLVFFIRWVFKWLIMILLLPAPLQFLLILQ